MTAAGCQLVLTTEWYCGLLSPSRVNWLVVAVVVWCGDGDDALAFSAPVSFCEVNQQRGSFLCFVTMRVLRWYFFSVELVRANKSKFGVLFTHIDGCCVCVCAVVMSLYELGATRSMYS